MQSLAGHQSPSESPNARAMQDSSWADGLRGIAAIYVAASHVSLCFARSVVNVCCADDETRTPALWQRPIFRLIASGHSWVAVFFVLLGFVNALKPLKQARSGNVEGALAGLATASFRRSFRLVLPAATATIISWTLAQLGAYEIARFSDAYWLQTYSPAPSLSWGTALEDLVGALGATWSLGVDNIYDQPQWALVYLLEGSIIVFFVLLATVNLTGKWRATVVGLCIFWGFDWTVHLLDPMVTLVVLGGVLLAEFSLTSYPAALAESTVITSILAPFFAIVGLVCMSMPSGNPEGMPWSLNLATFFAKITPEQAQWDLNRVISSLGALMLCMSIICSPQLRRLMSLPVLKWLGKLSFPIYLLHATFMRTIMAWFVFAGRPSAEFETKDAEGEVLAVHRYTQPGNFRIFLGIVIGMGFMLAAAHVWANRLEPVFGRITAWAEGHMKGKDEGQGILNGKPNGSPKEG